MQRANDMMRLLYCTLFTAAVFLLLAALLHWP
jgi:hypothetical protein